jgi:hypothetical protein
VDTKDYGGDIHKSAVVRTNDPEWGEAHISIKAHVRVPIYLSSSYVSMDGVEGQIITRTIHIRGQLEQPLELIPNAFNLDGKVNYTLEEIEKGRKFKVHFTNTPGSTPYEGYLKLKTNYPEHPEITLGIIGLFVRKGEEGK